MGDEEFSRTSVEDLIKKGILKKSEDPEPDPAPVSSIFQSTLEQKVTKEKLEDGIYFHPQNMFSAYLLKIIDEEVVEARALKRPNLHSSDYTSKNAPISFIDKYVSISDLTESNYVCSFEDRPLDDTKLYELFAGEHTRLAAPRPEPQFTRIARSPTSYGHPSVPTYYGAPSYPTPTLTGPSSDIDPPRMSVFGTPQPSDYPPPPDPRRRGRRPAGY